MDYRPYQLKLFATVLNEYCRAHGVSTSADRETIALRLMFLYASGGTDLKALRSGLDHLHRSIPLLRNSRRQQRERGRQSMEEIMGFSVTWYSKAGILGREAFDTERSAKDHAIEAFPEKNTNDGAVAVEVRDGKGSVVYSQARRLGGDKLRPA